MASILLLKLPLLLLLSGQLTCYTNQLLAHAKQLFQEGNNNNNLKKAPGGLLWFQPWIKLQYAATAAFVATVYSNYLTAAHASIQCLGGLVQPSDLMDLARSQADYILRKNPMEMSYTVGFGANYPTQRNHRGASIVSIKTDRIAHPSGTSRRLRSVAQ